MASEYAFSAVWGLLTAMLVICLNLCLAKRASPFEKLLVPPLSHDLYSHQVRERYLIAIGYNCDPSGTYRENVEPYFPVLSQRAIDCNNRINNRATLTLRYNRYIKGFELILRAVICILNLLQHMHPCQGRRASLHSVGATAAVIRQIQLGCVRSVEQHYCKLLAEYEAALEDIIADLTFVHLWYHTLSSSLQERPRSRFSVVYPDATSKDIELHEAVIQTMFQFHDQLAGNGKSATEVLLKEYLKKARGLKAILKNCEFEEGLNSIDKARFKASRGLLAELRAIPETSAMLLSKSWSLSWGRRVESGRGSQYVRSLVDLAQKDISRQGETGELLRPLYAV